MEDEIVSIIIKFDPERSVNDRQPKVKVMIIRTMQRHESQDQGIFPNSGSCETFASHSRHILKLQCFAVGSVRDCTSLSLSPCLATQ
jgi:hypothetical protein